MHQFLHLHLILLDSKTTVSVIATAVNTITGTAADINTAYLSGANGTISGLAEMKQ